MCGSLGDDRSTLPKSELFLQQTSKTVTLLSSPLSLSPSPSSFLSQKMQFAKRRESVTEHRPRAVDGPDAVSCLKKKNGKKYSVQNKAAVIGFIGKDIN